MVAGGYMTELDTESIWDVALDTARFGKINIRLGEMLNFWLTHDSATDITDTKVLPILEQISEEALTRLIAAAKMSGVTQPWDFIKANVMSIMSKTINDNRTILTEVKIVLDKKHRIKFTNKLTLPSHSD